MKEVESGKLKINGRFAPIYILGQFSQRQEQKKKKETSDPPFMKPLIQMNLSIGEKASDDAALNFPFSILHFPLKNPFLAEGIFFIIPP